MLCFMMLPLFILTVPLKTVFEKKVLVKMQTSLISQDDNRYYLRSKTTEQAKQILKVLSIRKMPDLIPEKMIGQYV